MPRYEKKSEDDEAVLVHQTKEGADDSALNVGHIDDLDGLEDSDELDADIAAQDKSEDEAETDDENKQEKD